MSLKHRINDKNVGKVFRKHLRNPGFDSKPPLLVEPTGINPSLLGTAFDYALRFGLRNHPLILASYSDSIVAKNVLAFKKTDEPELADLRRFLNEESSEIHAIFSLLDDEIEGFCVDDELSNSQALLCFQLSLLDEIYRSRSFESYDSKVKSTQIMELKGLWRAVPWDFFKKRRFFKLNPTFHPSLAERIGGADADLISLDTMIEIKTLKRAEISFQTLKQLVGYLILENLGNILYRSKEEGIQRIGLYLSRHGYYCDWNILDLLDDEESIVPLTESLFNIKLSDDMSEKMVSLITKGNQSPEKQLKLI